MRADETLNRRSFRFSEGWKKNALTGESNPDIDQRLNGGRVEEGTFIAHSLSGNERNHFYLNRRGQQFKELSKLSGLDNPADGRGFVLLDYDRDGWQDIALVNANEPLVNLYHNEMAKLQNTDQGGASEGSFIAVKFVGGNKTSEPSKMMNRDGYGTMVMANLGDLNIKREHRCGEGFATQNSATMILGIGNRAAASTVTVRWPSGQSVSTENVPAGTLLTVYENPADSPSGEAFQRNPYSRATTNPNSNSTRTVSPSYFPLAKSNPHPDGDFHVYTTMATWCAACIEHVPEMNLMVSTLAPEGVTFTGIPIDVADDAAKLDQFVSKWKPPYDLMSDLSTENRQLVQRFLQQMTQTENPGVPATIITDRTGKVLLLGSGVPSISVIRKLIADQPPAP